MIQAALNGPRSGAEHGAIPICPAHLATEARASVAAGAEGIHVHVRDADGNESLEAGDVAATHEPTPGVVHECGMSRWHDRGMPPTRPLHRPPRRPHAWAWALAASQLVVAFVWWRLGRQAR